MSIPTSFLPIIGLGKLFNFGVMIVLEFSSKAESPRFLPGGSVELEGCAMSEGCMIEGALFFAGKPYI